MCAIGRKIEASAVDAILGGRRNRHASIGEARATSRCIALQLVDVEVLGGQVSAPSNAAHRARYFWGIRAARETLRGRYGARNY